MKMDDCDARRLGRSQRGIFDLNAVAAALIFIEFGAEQSRQILLHVRKIGREFHAEIIHAVLFCRDGDKSRGYDGDLLIFDVQRDFHGRDLKGQVLIAAEQRRCPNGENQNDGGQTSPGEIKNSATALATRHDLWGLPVPLSLMKANPRGLPSFPVQLARKNRIAGIRSRSLRFARSSTKYWNSALL